MSSDSESECGLASCPQILAKFLDCYNLEDLAYGPRVIAIAFHCYAFQG